MTDSESNVSEYETVEDQSQAEESEGEEVEESVPSDVENFKEGLTWNTFVKAYAEYHGVRFSDAMFDARDAWAEYKTLHKIVPKSYQRKGKKETAVRVPKTIVKKRDDIPDTKSGIRKQRMKLSAPPKGYKAVTTYVPDEDYVEEKVKYVKVRVPIGKEEDKTYVTRAQKDINKAHPRPALTKTVDAKPTVKVPPKGTQVVPKKTGLVKRIKRVSVSDFVEESE